MGDFFPPIEPYESGMLDVGDGHHMYWETCGNPLGQPVLYLHGGPGSGSSVGQRRFFDPVRHRAILVDQRGSGRSRPLANADDYELRHNTTRHLIADLEKLRQILAIETWTLLGLSWGTTLAMAYAQAHPRKVSALVLGLITTTSRREVEWLTEGVGRLFPEQWERFAGGVIPEYRRPRLIDSYGDMLNARDATIRRQAATNWCAWEDAHISLGPDHQPTARYEDPEFRYLFARLVTHYWRNAAFLEEDQLIRDAAILNGIPGIMIHGRYDVSSPLETAWRLKNVWDTSTLRVLDDAGHGSQESFPSAVIDALTQLTGS